MKKNIAILLLCIMCGLCGCRKNMEHSADDSNIFFYTDSATGVQYVIFSDVYKGGICPRYNTDGTLMIQEK